MRFDINEAEPLLRGAVFVGARRVQARRRGAPAGGPPQRHGRRHAASCPAGAEVTIAVTDSQGGDIDKRTVKLNDWSAADWSFTLPDDKPMGYYRIKAEVKEQLGTALAASLSPPTGAPTSGWTRTSAGRTPLPARRSRARLTARRPLAPRWPRGR